MVKSRKRFHSPLSLFFFRIRKEDYLLILWENKTEGAFDAIKAVVFVRATPRVLVIFDSNRLLEVDGCSCPFGNIVEGNQVRTSNPQLPSSPGLNEDYLRMSSVREALITHSTITTILRKSPLEVGHLMPVNVP